MDEERFDRACQLKDDGKLEESLQEFINIANDTDDCDDKPAAILYAAACLKMMGDWQRAKEQLDIVRLLVADSNPESENPERAECLRIAVAFEEGDILGGEGRSEEALAAFSSLLSSFAEQLREPFFRSLYEMTQMRRAFLLVDLGRWRDGLPILEEAGSFERHDGSVEFYLGYSYVASGDRIRVGAKLRKSLQMGLPKHLEYRAHCELGRNYHKLEDYELAKLELEKCAQTADPNYIRQSQLWRWIEVTCRHLGLKREAEHYRQLANPS
jgi:tetratricopeptide (TPR) repeat protein